MYQLEKMLDVFSTELDRNIEAVTELTPGSKEYQDVLSNIMDLHRISRYLSEDIKQGPQDDSETVVQAPIKEWTEEVKPVAKPTQNVTSGSLTKEELRAMLVEAANNGVQIQPILAKFVPEGKPLKFSEIPSSRYAELEEELNNAR